MDQYVRDLKRVVEVNYDITIFDIIKFKNVYKISAVEGNFCLKQCKCKFDKFKYILDVLDYLKKQEFDNILSIVETYSEEQYIEFNDVYFYMTEWIESRELNYSNYYDIIRASQNIGNFHNYTQGYKPSKNILPDYRWMKWGDIFNLKLMDIISFKESLKYRSDLDIFDRIYLENADKNIDLAKESIELLYKFEYEKIVKEHFEIGYICHHDLANHNVLIDSKGKIYFIDFDYVILDTYLHDLGSFINRCLKLGSWNEYKLNLIINSYRDIKRLPKREILLTLSFILFPNDFWQIGIQRYRENIRWSDERFLKRLNRSENDKQDKTNFIKSIIFK
ncbi:CotS family spore coat protein [Candidatus Arthromitus sp. SFB-rat-Yit]|uniref:CotS family spore coat protein n=1 Tax=Candidatus Arthromitus sp. SFB-rat-Yit TaxID=1041504 RepID=UPI000227A4DA|nr:CotS family spore coat protein [Candidatus Arthromitus sp. SFB-rat-Yit]BAK80965.1 spore coat protein CotS [Candidatus Arthromitus sp. SFB-rat-Yit]